MKIEFQNTRFLKVASNIQECPHNNLPEIVLAGRSNVGKSSFINSLFQNKKLARVSSSPGKTQLAVYFITDNSLLFVDLPGYGYAKTSHIKKKKYDILVNEYLLSGRKFSLIVLLLDIRHEPSDYDFQMKEWIEEKNIPFIVIMTKSDKIKPSELKSRESDIRNKLFLKDEIPTIPFSALHRTGTETVRKAILNIVR
jgi:GTP-binding protein